MAEAKAGATPPLFIGPPGRLRLSVPPLEASQAAALVDVRLPEALQAARGDRALRAGRQAARTRLRLSPQTPPGDYQVQLTWADGRQQEAKVTVQARPRLRITPSVLRWAAPTDVPLTAQLLVENKGNVPIDIPDALLTGVFDDNGIEAAMASVYRMDSTDLNHLLGQAFARLKEAHGGLLKLRVREGAGALAPGAQRVLVLETRLGDKLVPGHSYHGVIDIGIHGVAVEIQVQKTVSGAPR